MINVNKIELWKCKKDILAKPNSVSEQKREMLIKEGEIVEFRYHHSIHFRTEDDLYFVLSEEVFYANFEPYGQIFKDVKWNNKCLLKDILEHSLFDRWEIIKNYSEFKEVAE